MQATRRILGADDKARVLILTTFDLDEYVYEALHAGASGFVLKDDPPEQLIAAIRIVAGGDALLSPGITKRVIKQFTRIPHRAPPRQLDDLTERELDVFRLTTGSAQISSSGQIAFATVTLTKQAAKITTVEAKKFVGTAKAGAGHGVQVELEGQVAKAATRPSVSSTGLGAAAALVVLLLVFGSLLAATLPLLTAGIALGSSIAVIALLSHLLNIASFSSELSLLIGLGVGIDYALFIVTRFRQGLQRGKPIEQAIVDAIDTSGRAVMFAGIIVCIALLGMFALGVSFIYGVAVAPSIAVLFTVIAALTLLPALLGFFGTRVLGRKARRRLAAGELSSSDESPSWGRWARTLRERPALIAAAAAA